VASPFKSIGKTLKKPQVYWPLLIVLVGILITIGCYFLLGRWLDAIVIGLAVVIIGLMAVILWTFFSMDKEDRLERGIDDPRREVAAPAPSESMEQSFRRAVEEITSSRLGAAGVESLPWILMLGESGEGKTAAVRESGLELPAEYARRVTGAPTQSVDWWFTNDAIVLDLAGRFVACESDDTQSDWQTLLKLLRKQRPGVALNGVIFTISIDSLLTRSEPELDEVARSLRRRINEVTDGLGVDLPVYVLVTKVDHVEGLVECIHASPLVDASDAVGWTNDQRMLADTEGKVVEGFQGLLRRVESYLPGLLLRDPDPRRRRRIFAFPQEFALAIRAVARFVDRAFATTPYDTPPYLRGIYFASARREGATVSPLLHRLGHSWARNQVEGSLPEGGFLLRDFFREIVIGDRELALPADRFGPRMLRALNVAVAFVVALLMLWWVAAGVSNGLGIQRIKREAAAVAAGSSSLATLDALRSAIEGESQDMRILRRGGLGNTMERALERAQETFAWGFGREFESPTKRKAKAIVRGFDAGAFEALAQLASDVTWLAKRGDPEQAGRPEFAPYAPISGNETDVEAFKLGYDAFVRWSSHDEIQLRIDQESEVVASAAARLLELKRLESWAESSNTYLPIRYSDTGLPGAEDDDASYISSAYTRKAWDGLVVRLLEAIDTTGTASSKAKEFRNTYVKRYQNRWRDFMMNTPTPVAFHPDPTTSPYLAYIEQLHHNTSADLSPRDGPPHWVQVLQEIRREEPLPEEEGAKDEEGEEEPAEPPPPPWTVYQEAMTLVAADVEAAKADSEVAIAMSVLMAERKPNSFSKAIKVVNSMVPQEGDPGAAEKLEAILAMPILDSASTVLGEAMRELNLRWAARIAQPYAGELSSAELGVLYGDGGDLAEFWMTELKPFYKDGRATRAIGNRGLPMGGRFLAWMRSADKLQRVLGGSSSAGLRLTAELEGIPAQVLDNQRMRVAERVIRLRCSDDVQTFRYSEGTGRHTFEWSPDCNELSLRISVLDGSTKRELLPAKVWKGPMALPDFLRQANRSGDTLRWTLRYAESDVTVSMSYRLRGGKELLAMIHRSPPNSMGN